MLAAIWTDWNCVVDKIAFLCSWVHATFRVEVLFDCSSYAAYWWWEVVADAIIYLISLSLQKHGCVQVVALKTPFFGAKIEKSVARWGSIVFTDHFTKGRAPLQHLQTQATGQQFTRKAKQQCMNFERVFKPVSQKSSPIKVKDVALWGMQHD